MAEYLFNLECSAITCICLNCPALTFCGDLDCFCSKYENVLSACITALEMGY